MVSHRVLSLFSGIGLHDLGLQRAGWEIATQCEVDPWCREVLKKNFPSARMLGDIRDVSARSIRKLGKFELITGGFPCPDISVAGRGMGIIRGGRSSLWLEMLRIIRACNPTFVLAENVSNLYSRGIDTVLAGLEEAGYAAWPSVVGAWAIGAPHRRERAWIVGVRVGDTKKQSVGRRSDEARESDAARNGKRMAHPDSLRREQLGRGGIPDDRQAPYRNHPDGRDGEGLAHADSAVLEEHESERGNARKEQPTAPGSGGARNGQHRRRNRTESGRIDGQGRSAEAPLSGCAGAKWPARRGEPQYEWEPPRVLESGLGRGAGRDTDRMDRFARRNRLRALGNGNPPQVPEMIGRWLLENFT